jgi:hypothetical protein
MTGFDATGKKKSVLDADLAKDGVTLRRSAKQGRKTADDSPGSGFFSLISVVMVCIFEQSQIRQMELMHEFGWFLIKCFREG